MARQRHPNMQLAEAQIALTRARLEGARAGFFPGVTGSFSYQPQTANLVFTPGFQRFFSHPTPTTLVNGDAQVACVNNSTACSGMAPQTAPPASYAAYNYWTGALGLYWNAFDWGKTAYGFVSARTTVEAQGLSAQATLAQIELDVKIAFYEALAARASVDVAKDSLATQQRHAAQARAFYDVGSRTRIDVASADSDVAAAELTVARANGALEASDATLAAAIGLDEWKPFELVVPPAPSDAPAPSQGALFDEALKSRPEPKELTLRARSMVEQWRSARGQFLPALILQAGPNWAGTDITALATNFQVTASLAFPLFGMNPYLIYEQMREAKANELTFLAQERQIRNQIRLEAANARAALDSARESVISARKLVDAAKVRRDLAEGRYKEGVGNIIELSDAQLAFINARFQEVRANFDLAEADARLVHALGRR
jgi:outer membrane protein